MKFRLILIFSSIFLILVGVFIGINYKLNIPIIYPLDENLQDFKISTDLAEINVSIYGIPTAESLLEQSPLIAIVKPTGKRELSKGGFFISQAIVESIIKGDEKIKCKQYIDIYENNKLNYFEWSNPPEGFILNNKVIYVNGGTNVLREGKQYLVFLDVLDMPSYYEFTGKRRYSYMYADKNFGQFPLEINNYLIIDNKDTYIYKDVMHYDCIVPSEKFYELYKTLYDEVMKEVS